MVRGSLNVDIEDWTPEEIIVATTLVCDVCGKRFAPVGTLTIETVESKLVLRPVAASARCPCGSRDAPVMQKPEKGSADWWDDPLEYLGCPSCGRAVVGRGSDDTSE
jgi:hypothetical protein